MEERLFVETTIENWTDLFQFSHIFLSNFIYRGQANEEWDLLSSLERHVDDMHQEKEEEKEGRYLAYEIKIDKEFRRKYPMYECYNVPREDEHIEWQSIMRHYGVPTRLLDFSKSLFVALFMAIDNAEKADCAIWALNRSILYEGVEKIYRKKHNLPETDSVLNMILDEMSYNYANNEFDAKDSEEDIKLYMIEPRRCFERISKQQSVFVMPSKLNVKLHEQILSLCNDRTKSTIGINELISCGEKNKKQIALLKIKIPNILKPLLRKSLNQMNVNSETLYPGLDGLARSMYML